MISLSDGELKARFSEELQRVAVSEENIRYGEKKEIVAKLVPETGEKNSRRKLGILDGHGKINFKTDFKITQDDFLGI